MQADALQTGTAPGRGLRSAMDRYRSAAIMAASRLAAVATQFAVQAAVGALGGASALGLLQLFQSWSSIGGEIAARGLPTRMMRDSAVDFANGNIACLQQRLRHCTRVIASSWIAAIALIAAVMTVLYALDLDTGDSKSLLYTLCAALLAAPLFALLRLTADTLKAMDAATPAVLVESLVVPGALLASAAALWLSGQPMTTTALLAAGVAGYLAAPTAMAWLIRRRAKQSTHVSNTETANGTTDRKDGNILWASSLLSVAFLHLPFMVLPFFATAADIGVYAVANKLMGIVTMLLLLLAAVFGPAFARDAALGGGRLKQLLQRSQLYSCIVYLPLAAALVLAHPLLALLFNVPPQELQMMLLVLGAGHLVNAVTGLSGVLLNMAGAARLELAATAAATAIALVASPLVGAAHGHVGLAVLFSVAIIVKNLLSFSLATHYLQRTTQPGTCNHETA